MENSITTQGLKNKIQKEQAGIMDVRGVLRTTTTFNDASEGWQREEILEKPPTKQRQETIDCGGEIPDRLYEQFPLPEPAVGQAFVTNGTTGWQYNPETETVRRYLLEDNSEGSFTDTGDVEELLTANATVTLGRESTVAGRDGQGFDITYPESNPFFEESSLILDAEYGYPLKRCETLNLDENLVSSERVFEEVIFNDGISDESFEFHPPETATVVEETK